VSALFELHRLPDGTLALVHYDQDLMGQDFVSVRVDLYVSFVSPDRSATCVDQWVTSTTLAQPKIAFHGDTLFMASQTVEGDDAATWISAFHVDPEACEAWSR